MKKQDACEYDSADGIDYVSYINNNNNVEEEVKPKNVKTFSSSQYTSAL